MKLRYLLLVGGLTFVIALLVQAPAAWVYAWTSAAQPDAPVRLHGVDGSLFAGRALQASRGSQALLRQLRWTAEPSALLLGRAAYHVTADAPPTLLDGHIAVGLGGTRISDLKSSGELRAVAAMFGQAFVPMNGQVGLQIERLRMTDHWPTAAEGEIRVSGLAWTLGREPVPLGDYQAQVTTVADELVATVSTLAGVVDVSGEGRLKPDRSYELDLKLRPRPDAPAVVANLLRQLGSTDAQGNYRLRRTVAAASASGAVNAPPEAPPSNRSNPPADRSAPAQDPAAGGAVGSPASAAAPQSTPAPQPAADDESGLTFGP